MGEWKDEPRNGLDFKKRESPRNQRKKAGLLKTMVNGNREEWDCTMLFYAILYSDCIGGGLNAIVRSNVDDLRNFRNHDFAHLPQGHVKESEFQSAVAKVEVAFQALGLSDLKIKEIRNQKSFPTSELKKVLQEVNDLKNELKQKEQELKEKGETLKETEQHRKLLQEQLQTEAPAAICILPPKPSHDVAERDHELAKISQQLKQLKETNESRLTSLYISGNPGSGKSQLARLAAKKFFDEKKQIAGENTFVMTLNAQSLDSLLESYVSFARFLKCPEYAVTNIVIDKGLKTEGKIANIKSLIGKVELYSSWLLVVDNVDSLSEMNPHLPETENIHWCKGQLLITSQDTAAIPSENSFINHISVSKGMIPSDAISLLASLSGIAGDETEEEVARALDYQPLALASAAIFVKQVREASSNFGWKGLLEKINNGQRANTEAFLAMSNQTYPISMTTAISLAVDKAMSSDKVLYHAFSFISLCGQQPLNLDLVIKYVLNVENKSGRSGLDEFADEDIIGLRIRKSSLLLLQEDKGGVHVQVHQIVRNVTQTRIKKFSEAQYFQLIHWGIISFKQFIDEKNLDDVDSISNSFQLVPHLKCLITEIESVFSVDDLSEVMKNTNLSVKDYPNHFVRFSTICAQHCDFRRAKSICNLALKLIQRGSVFGEEHSAAVYSKIGDMHYERGEFQEAKRYHEISLKIRPQDNDSDVENWYNDMARVLHGLGDLEKAKKYNERALAIRRDKLGPQHINVATSYNNIGAVISDQGNLELAKEYFERALAILLQNQETHQIDLAITYNNLASVLHDQGHLKQAKEYCERALAIGFQKLGSQHYGIAIGYDTLAGVLRDQGDLEQAKKYLEHALAIRLKMLGSEHIVVAYSYNNIGSVLRDQGDLEQAKEYFQHALAIRLKVLGSEHIVVASSYNNIGSVLRDQGDLEQAKKYHERALAILLQKLESEHIHVAASYNNIGLVLCDQGDLDQAKKYHERALDIFLQKLGSEHIHVATSYNNIGLVLCDQGDLEQAKEYLEHALAIRLKMLGSEHFHVASSYNNIGLVLRHQGDLGQAKEYHKHALTIQIVKLGSQHIHVADSYNNLGVVLRDQGELEHAKKYFDRALAIYLIRLGPQHSSVTTVQRHLAGLQNCRVQ